jgi:predicted ester cyclase
MAHDLRFLSREWFEEVWNQRSAAAIDQLAASDVIIHGLTEDREPARGTGAFKQFWKSFLSAFPDLKVTVEDVLLEGDKTAIRIAFGGTHSGEGIGIAATNRRFNSTAIIIVLWREGKIAESWNEFDAAGMMRQLQAPAAQLRA